jgi:hypothetical protein
VIGDGGVLGGSCGSLGASMTLSGGRCLRQCGMERMGVPEGDCDDAWSGGSPSRQWHMVAALVAIEEQNGKMGWKREAQRGGKNETGLGNESIRQPRAWAAQDWSTTSSAWPSALGPPAHGRQLSRACEASNRAAG